MNFPIEPLLPILASQITGIRSWVFDMKSFAGVVRIENERCSSNHPARQAVQIPPSDMIGKRTVSHV
jgi:hypothetical protein